MATANVATIPGMEWTAGPRSRAAHRMIDILRGDHRLAEEDEPMAELFFKLAETLDNAAPGRGASIALVAVQFKDVWRELKQLKAPVEPGVEEFDVALLPVADES